MSSIVRNMIEDVNEQLEEVVDSIKSNDSEDAFRLILDSMKRLLDCALTMVEIHGSKHEYDRARAYWHAAIAVSLSSDHDYLDKYTPNMEQTIDAIFGDKEKNDEEEEESEE